jgi:hypothetical protein
MDERYRAPNTFSLGEINTLDVETKKRIAEHETKCEIAKEKIKDELAELAAEGLNLDESEILDMVDYGVERISSFPTLRKAVKNCNEGAITWFKKHGWDPLQDKSLLNTCLHMGNIDAFIQYFEQGCSLANVDENTIFYSVKSEPKNWYVIKYLYDKGYRFSSLDKVLPLVTNDMGMDFAEELVLRGNNNLHKYYCLTHCVIFGLKHHIDRWLRLGCDHRNNDDELLVLAVAHKKHEVAKYLIALGCDPSCSKYVCFARITDKSLYTYFVMSLQRQKRNAFIKKMPNSTKGAVSLIEKKVLLTKTPSKQNYVKRFATKSMLRPTSMHQQLMSIE